MYGVRPFVALLQNKHNLIFKCFFVAFPVLHILMLLRSTFLLLVYERHVRLLCWKNQSHNSH